MSLYILRKKRCKNGAQDRSYTASSCACGHEKKKQWSAAMSSCLASLYSAISKIQYCASCSLKRRARRGRFHRAQLFLLITVSETIGTQRRCTQLANIPSNGYLHEAAII
ncbi:unnamed protein product [Trichogramma brassicae]|uniref:Uncharacterized protein n=1 Tax=Trichogramma brassicae TaxID=86971 RepID=A0A6H5IW97_9HYME|nr:unnamed protein product [Trichogramma brassicae]